MSMGKIERADGRIKESTAQFQMALEIALQTKASDFQAQFLVEMAATSIAGDAPRTALEKVRQALVLLQDLDDDATRVRALDFGGEAALLVGDKSLAREYSRAAIDCYQRLLEEASGSPVDRATYAEQMLSPYVRLTQMEADAGKIDNAFAVVETARARVLAGVLESGNESVTASMSTGEQAGEKQLRASIARASAGKNRDAARLAHRAFLNELYAKNPQLRVSRLRSEPVTAAKAAEVLPDARTVMLEYLVTPKETLVFAISRNRRVRLFRVRLEVGEIRKRVNAYREMLAAKDLDYREAAASLYRLLVGPAEAELTGRTSVVILPSGPLWDLPFQALTRGDGRFVGETLAVSYAPSVTVLAALAKRPRVTTVSKVLAMAQGMPEAEEEVNAVAALYGTRAFTGTAARESTFKSQAAGYGILHLASHGVFENGSPMYSYIALGKDGAEDGRLEAAELMNMELKARLAILSACETARGRIGAGEGVMGLTWALAVAGVPTTIASGWKVDSKVTAELMVELHRGLRAGLGPAEALRKASMKVMAQPSYRHPFYWASFGVYGLGW